MDKVEFPMVDVLRLRPMEGHRIWLRFSNGREGVYDLSGCVMSGGPMVAPLKDPVFFARVFIESGAPSWPNGFDLDPIKIYMDLRDAKLLTKPDADAAE